MRCRRDWVLGARPHPVGNCIVLAEDVKVQVVAVWGMPSLGRRHMVAFEDEGPAPSEGHELSLDP